MREFYVYGFKSREDYNRKSSRSYDDERRRMESWLGDHMSFVRTPEGKNMFISIDSRVLQHNPLYKAWKSKSFTDGDITLHFILFDILHSSNTELSIHEILAQIDGYLAEFDTPMVFDESTVRKKLKEYCEEGLIFTEKQGRKVLYRRAPSAELSDIGPLLDFYSEIAPCGVIGSFILDKIEPHEDPFTFKHHYITGAIDSGVTAALLSAMRQKNVVTVSNLNRKRNEPRKNRIIPLRLFISVQNGRQNLLAYQPEFDCIKSFRVDYLSNVKLEGPTPRFEELRARLDTMEQKMWGVNIKSGRRGAELEHVDFTVRIESGEEYIVKRLEREKRVGRIERIDEHTYRFVADVYDSGELVPWIRTFICRITRMNFSNRTVENRFKQDLQDMYRMYGIGEGDET
ncbi:MAG: WYL domain-containing protein [Clostridia bacterium]|nr:WYL domain-containing protein [Clostridia bacterium]